MAVPKLLSPPPLQFWFNKYTPPKIYQREEFVDVYVTRFEHVYKIRLVVEHICSDDGIIRLTRRNVRSHVTPLITSSDLVDRE